MEMEFDTVIYDASPWAGQFETLFASAFGMVPPAPMQLELANQLRTLMSELALVPLEEATSEFGWLLARTSDSIVVFFEDRTIAAQLGVGGAVATIEMGSGDAGAWSIQWDTPLEGVLGSDLLGGFLGDTMSVSSRPRPAVRIGIFMGNQRVSETAFDHAGGWEDELDDQPLLEETQRRLEEACNSVQLPDDDRETGVGSTGSGPADTLSSGDTGRNLDSGGGGTDLGGMAFKGAAALAGMAAGALAREAMKSKAKPDPPARPSAELKPHPSKPEAQSTPERRVCPECGKSLSARARFCPGCGATVPEEIEPVEEPARDRPKFCSGCGTPTQENDRFCRSCGKAL